MRSALLAPLCGLWACSSPALPPAADLSTPAPPSDLSELADLSLPDLAEPDDLTLSPDLNDPYPPGPYGHLVGDRLQPLTWEGYVNPTAKGLATAKAYTTLALNDVRRSGNKYLLLYAADQF
jgi:hypothetical protein